MAYRNIGDNIISSSVSLSLKYLQKENPVNNLLLESLSLSLKFLNLNDFDSDNTLIQSISIQQGFRDFDFIKPNYIIFNQELKGIPFELGVKEEEKEDEELLITRLSYLQSDGNLYIDTGILANSDNGFEISFQMVSFVNSEFLGGGVNYSDGLGICTHGGGSLGLICGTTNIARYNPGNTDHVISIKNNIATVDGSVVGQSTTSSTTTNNFYVFRKNPYGNSCGYKCYYLKLWDNKGNLVRDFIPCLDSNQRPCLFDLITNLPFYNLGTGEFLYG